jgi:hypothetical protein
MKEVLAAIRSEIATVEGKLKTLRKMEELASGESSPTATTPAPSRSKGSGKGKKALPAKPKRKTAGKREKGPYEGSLKERVTAYLMEHGRGTNTAIAEYLKCHPTASSTALREMGAENPPRAKVIDKDGRAPVWGLAIQEVPPAEAPHRADPPSANGQGDTLEGRIMSVLSTRKMGLAGLAMELGEDMAIVGPAVNKLVTDEEVKSDNGVFSAVGAW